MAEITVDAKGSSCPGPITELSKAYRKSQVGDTITIFATDPGINADAKAWCEHTGNKLLELKEENGVITVKIEIVKR